MNTALLQTAPAVEKYTVRFAGTAAEIEAAQRLRYRVFNLELAEGLATSLASGRDEDAFDAVCDHLLVVEESSGAVVGTYRMQTGEQAASGRGYYSAQEFEFGVFEPVRSQVLELGRACVAAEHRNQVVLGLLWKGILQRARREGLRYLIGCSSLSSQDEAGALVTYGGLSASYLAESRWRTLPVASCRCRAGAAEPLALPRLMVAYLVQGCRICGEPAIDREFGTIDFLTLMDLENVSERFRRKYLA